jgi:peptidoglycan/LPS O-acetylase OafA/YrhL
MKKIATIFVVIGLFLGLFSAIVPYADIFSAKWENRIYFRGILLGFLLISFSAALIENRYIQDAIISLGSGIMSLLFISTLNLLIDTPQDDIIKTEFYFTATFWIIGGVFIILTISRLWLNKLLTFIGL